MLNMKIITVITLVFMVSVALLHSVSFTTKVIIDLLLFLLWAFFAIVRAAGQRRRARQSRQST